MFDWLKSTRSIAVILTFVLLFIVVLFDKLEPKALESLITFLVGLVIGGYFGKRDEEVRKQ